MTTCSPDKDFTAFLARDLAALGYIALSEKDREQIKRLLMDHIGVCRRGVEMPWCLGLRDCPDVCETDS